MCTENENKLSQPKCPTIESELLLSSSDHQLVVSALGYKILQQICSSCCYFYTPGVVAYLMHNQCKTIISSQSFQHYIYFLAVLWTAWWWRPWRAGCPGWRPRWRSWRRVWCGTTASSSGAGSPG